MSTTQKIAAGSLIVGLVVLALKGLAYWMTGSVALYSDALESTVNVATAIAALVAIRWAELPADENHHYGHYKAEFLAAVLEGALIIVAAVMILREAWGALFDPRMIEAPLPGLAVNMAATALNGVWAAIIIRQGRRRKSMALVADGRHLMSDVVTSFGVALGIVLALITGLWILDPLMAALVAVNILWSGARLIRESLSSLMDEAVPEAVLERVRAIITEEAQGAVEAHDLRTRHAGRATFIDFHLVVPGEMSVTESHEICDRLEAALKAEIPDAWIAIHVEPDFKAKPDVAIEVITGK
ncbi:MAG: cation diffusion facilitator family transporter [Pseudooceanicola sp.]